jgi:hypothetical protein
VAAAVDGGGSQRSLLSSTVEHAPIGGGGEGKETAVEGRAKMAKGERASYAKNYREISYIGAE